MSLASYRRKRNFRITPEPGGDTRGSTSPRRQYVIQHHDASRLHFDFRLELDGVLKSWAVPKGPSLDPEDRVLAVHVEDHPLDYAGFEGVIPEQQYGAGPVQIWDRGTWTPLGDPARDYQRGKLKFELHGERLHGRWSLVRMSGRAGEDGKNWLLIKSRDKAAMPGDGHRLAQETLTSIVSGRTLPQIAAQPDRLWQGGGAQEIEPEGLALPAAARSQSLPKEFRPQLATLVSDPPAGDEWLHELKYDGYRLLARCDEQVRLLTRNGNDWTDRFPKIARAVAELGVRGTLLDGELVMLDQRGATDFGALQNSLNNGRDDDLAYYVFDLPYVEGHDLTDATQLERKTVLKQLLERVPDGGAIRYSDHIRGQGRDVVAQACRLGLEGIVSKRAEAPYRQRRSRNWVKSKCLKRQEFVVVGWTDPSGSRSHFGALLLAYYDEGELVYSGRVGTGFDRQTLEELGTRLADFEQTESPLAHRRQSVRGAEIHWVAPELVVEVEFTDWTADGLLRHPAFQGLREDKPPKSVRREAPMSPQKLTPAKRQKARPAKDDARVAGIHISSPDRVVYPEQGITKRVLAEYYADIADYMLPYVAHRPLTVVRCPQGRQQKCFYQKHATEGLPEAVGQVTIQENDDAAQYITIDDASGLVALVQMGALEFHPWGSRNDRLEKPDTLIFDLDPGPDAPWGLVVAGAQEIRSRLSRAGLESYVRTSGGKGLHVVAPLTRRQSWDVLKQFARQLAESIARDAPEQFVATASKAVRHGKVYIDYLRNSRGATAVANYSTRARAGAPVAAPLSWQELSAGVSPDQYRVNNLRTRFDALKADPWEGYHEQRQSITKQAMKSVAIPRSADILRSP